MQGFEVLNELNVIINDYVSQFDLTAELGSDFCYYSRINTIHYALAVVDRAGENFKEFANSLKPNMQVPIFLLSLLHEIGHHETWEVLTDEEISYSTEIKNLIQEEQVFTKETDFIYFNLPDERIATEWALKYIEDNTREIRAFWNKIQNLIVNFYEAYGITEED
jgi:hypothetical protein